MQKSKFLILFPLIALGIHLGSRGMRGSWHFVMFGLSSGLWLYLAYRGSKQNNWLYWLTIILACFCLGDLHQLTELSWQQTQSGEFRGIVNSVQKLTFEQRVLVRLQPGGRQVALHLPPEQMVTSGQKLSFSGTIERPPQAPNPGVFCYRSYLKRLGVFGLCYPETWEVSLEIEKNLLAGIKTRIQNNLRRGIQEPGLLLALILGEREHLGQERKECWQKLGISHLLAISGLHVGLLAVGLGFFSQHLPLPGWVRLLLTQLLLLGYIILTGSGTSAWRAFLVSVLGATAGLRRIAHDPFRNWALVGFFLLLQKPALLFDLSFQLSFTASGGILLWLPVFQKPPRNRPLGYVFSSLLMSILAQFSILPLLLGQFGEVALLGPVSTLLFLPLVAILLLLGLGVAFGLGFLGLAKPINALMVLLGALETNLWPWARQWSSGVTIEVLLWWGLFVYAGWRLRLPRLTKPRRTLAQLTLMAAALFFITSLPPLVLRPLEVTALNVGQGDCYYLKTPSGTKLLIDGGGDSPYWQERGRNVGKERVLPYLRERKVEYLDYVILSHPHEDHLFGLLAVLEEIEVGMVLDNGHSHTSPSYVRYLELIIEKKIPYRKVQAGEQFSLGDGIIMNVLYPQRVQGDLPSAYNNNSLLLQVKFGGIRLLFTGDLEYPVLYDLAKNLGSNLRAHWLKVPHHGSKSSLVEEFYQVVQPKWAVISVGKNSFGHPHPQVTEFLNKQKITWSTTEHGPVTFLVWWGLWGRFLAPRS